MNRSVSTGCPHDKIMKARRDRKALGAGATAKRIMEIQGSLTIYVGMIDLHLNQATFPGLSITYM